MRVYDIIAKKKQGKSLSEFEIREFISEYTAGNIPDYQVSALLMAICLNGMNERETVILTDAIAKSGDTVDLAEFGRLSADKHSTGGVGDKTSLIVAPLAATLGCKVAKMSGRGLGHTGGTVDKLEAIRGYKTNLSREEFCRQVRDIGVAIIAQSGNLAPADKKLYALRDVTATVDSIPLITSSIMGKKLASGSHTIVLDVKCGSGAFLKTEKEAEILAKNMVSIGKASGRSCAALITNMDIPLGFAIGNTLEVKEAIDVLSGKGPSDLTEICIELASLMAHLSLDLPLEMARNRARAALVDGRAFNKFKEWTCRQGGDASLIENPDTFDGAEFEAALLAECDGYISAMDTEKIGLAAMELGAGRKTKEDKIDFAAGIVLAKKTGDKVTRGEKIATLYTNKKETVSVASEIFNSAISYSEEKLDIGRLIYNTIT